MPWAYFDTSAFIKRYVDEPGRAEVLQLLRRNYCVTSAVLPIEVRSALRRCIAEGTLAEDRAPEILRRLGNDRTFWTQVEVTTEVLSAAETLVALHPLRALDAIHVASAQIFARRAMGSDLTFVSADARQTAAAAAAGLRASLVVS